MENKYYVYAHINPLKNEIFYIGKGTRKRAYTNSRRSDFWHKITKKYGFIVDILEDGLTNEEACLREKFYIAKIGRRDLGKGPLVNLTDGGDNPPSHKGKKMSEETKAKISKALKGNKNGLGFIPSEETRKKISEATKGEKNWNWGGTLSDETKEKLRITSTGKKHKEAAKLKVSIAKKGKPLSEEHKKALRKPKSVKKYYTDEERKKAQLEANKRAYYKRKNNKLNNNN
jgi:hypothetical protein